MKPIDTRPPLHVRLKMPKPGPDAAERHAAVLRHRKSQRRKMLLNQLEQIAAELRRLDQ